MALNQLFKVATEFRFEIGSAMVGTKALTDQANKLSEAADNVTYSLARMGTGVIMNLGTGGAGLIGLLRMAVGSSESFRQSQISIANIVAANKDKLTGPIDTFSERMQFAERILKRVAKLAKEFSLPEQPFVEMTKLLSAQLVSKGLAGTNFESAIQLSRHFMKAAPNLGVDPQQSIGQLMRAIGGGASQGDTLFRRLSGETSAMAEFATNTKKFNQLKPHIRLAKLTEAMKQFTKSQDEVLARTRTLGAQYTALSNVIKGLDGIIKPLGDVLTPVLVDAMMKARGVLDTHGRAMFQEMANAVRPMGRNMRSTIATVLQLRDASADLKRTGNAFTIGAVFLTLGWVLSKVTKAAWLMHPALGMVAASIYVLHTAFARMNVPLDSLAGVFVALLPIVIALSMASFMYLASFRIFNKVLYAIPGLFYASSTAAAFLPF